MKILFSVSLVIAATLIPTEPVLAEETIPPCDEASAGLLCVERQEQVGPWSIEELVPPVGTQNSLMMSTPSFQPVTGIFGREEAAVLVLSCIENVTQFQVRFGENFMSDIGELGTLIFKLDDDAPERINVLAAEDNFSLGLFTGAEAIPLIRSMFDSDRLLVSARSFTGRDLTASFSIDEIETAVAPLRELCNW
jgi:type VI secretion system protein VasI